MNTPRIALWISSVVVSVGVLAFEPISLLNPSFEQPGTEKIRGWNGETGADIPGWASATQAVDSGVESDWPGSTDGSWSGFLMNGDPSVYQLTDWTISVGDVFELKVDFRDNWSETGPAQIFLGLFYDNAGVHTMATGGIFSYTAPSATEPWATATVLFDSADTPAAAGKKIGIELLNVTGIAGGANANSWMGVDNVRLSVTPIPEPGTVSLLAGAFFGLALMRRRS